MKTIAIVAGGNISRRFIPQIKKCDIVIGADRGAWWLLSEEIIPEYSVGDFDSVSKAEIIKIKETSPNVVQYNSEKNETDLELALELAISLHPSSISVFGGTGTRLDQTIVSIFLLEKFRDNEITFFDENNEVSIVNDEKILRKSAYFPYCSFLPLTSRATVSLIGFKYPLKKGLLYREKTLGVSNEIQALEGKIIVYKGTVIAIQSRG